MEHKGLPSVSLLSSQGSSPLHILVSTLLSARTRDDVTLSATLRFFEGVEKNDNAQSSHLERIAALEPADIERLIFPVAFFRQKAKAIRLLARRLLSEYGGEVPKTIESLTSLPGVGIKTASLVLGLAFDVPSICVDTHVQRISYRLGWTKNAAGPADRIPNVVETRLQLETLFQRSRWIAINTVLVKFGQTVCSPVSPLCTQCPVSANCPRHGVLKSR